MDIPLNVDVQCADRPGGRSTTIILNPVSNEITHVVVKDRSEEYLIPLDEIVESGPQHIQLRITYEEMIRHQRFVKMQFLGQEDMQLDVSTMMVAAESDATWWPYTTVEDHYADVYGQAEQVPHDELAIHRGAHVEASDGHIGTVDEFVVNPVNNHITHLVLRRGHLWGQKDVTIPISEIDHIGPDTVHLTLDKESVKALPAVPVRKRS
jgi:sporulation protein YlmC with PRC-barrel domain